MQLVKLGLDLGPLIIFFAVWYLAGGEGSLLDPYMPDSLTGPGNALFPATAALMAATLISLVASLALFRKIPTMPLVTAVLVMVFGGLTLYLADETFVKMKPTFVYLLFAAVLGAGMLLNRPFLKILFDEAFTLTPEGWRILTWRWTAFFVVLALLNEIIWRNFSTDIWIKVKVFGFIALTMIFAVAQVAVIQKFSDEEEE